MSADQTGRKPGDEVPPGTPQSDENTCPKCQGVGRIENKECPECKGTGTVITLIGDA
jgi:DnaJ-class molecular chaperone